MKKTTQGFIVPLVIALIAIIAIGAGFYAYNKNQQPKETAQENTTPGNVLGSNTTNIFAVNAGSTTNATTMPSGSALKTSLLLGDGKFTTSAAKKGYIYLCHDNSANGQGARVTGSWIHGNTWSPSEKVAVEGAVSWPAAQYSMKISGKKRLITSNDLPTTHTTGVFPIQSTDPAYAIDPNPGSIEAQSESYLFPVSPTVNAKPGCIYGEVGVMTDGVSLNDGFDALNRDAMAHEVQDSYDGHPNDAGYHYHGSSAWNINATLTKVIGFALDGFPITGSKLTSGKYLMTSDLDVCHGITSAISLDGKNVKMYHYVMTQDFPYSVSCFKGTSTVAGPGAKAHNQTTQNNSQSQGSNQPQSMPLPPQEAIDACSGKNTGDQCTVNSHSSTCQLIGQTFACARPQ